MPSLTKLKLVITAWLASLLLTGAAGHVLLAQSPRDDARLNADSFQSIHKQIKAQPGESLWMEIPWLTDLHEARQKAAAEGKPLFLISSGKGISIGMC